MRFSEHIQHPFSRSEEWISVCRNTHDDYLKTIWSKWTQPASSTAGEWDRSRLPVKEVSLSAPEAEENVTPCRLTFVSECPVCSLRRPEAVEWQDEWPELSETPWTLPQVKEHEQKLFWSQRAETKTAARLKVRWARRWFMSLCSRWRPSPNRALPLHIRRFDNSKLKM